MFKIVYYFEIKNNQIVSAIQGEPVKKNKDSIYIEVNENLFLKTLLPANVELNDDNKILKIKEMGKARLISPFINEFIDNK